MKLTILLFLSLLLSCNNDSVLTQDIKTITPLTQTILITDINPYIDNIEIINLEETKNSLISYIKKILINNHNEFVVLDSRGTITCFNSDGSYTRNIGKRGRGYGEYTKIEDMSYNNSYDLLLVLQLGSVLTYSMKDGSFISKVNTPRKNFDAISFSDSGFYLFSANPGKYQDFSNEFCALSKYNESGEVVKNYLPRKDFVFTESFFTQSYNKESILRPQEGDNIIYRISYEGPQAWLKIDFGDMSIPEKYVFKNKNLGVGIKDFMLSKHYKLPIYIQDTQEYLYFSCVGPNGKANDFIYSKDLNKGIHWEDLGDDNMPMYVIASDSSYMYVTLPNETIKDNHIVNNPLKSYIIGCVKEEFKNNNPKIVKIKFKL